MLATVKTEKCAEVGRGSLGIEKASKWRLFP
jgi:hypothetical protein